MKRLAPLLALAIGLPACAPEPLEFPDWTIPVPEGTRIIEYRGVPVEERDGEPIQVIREVEIGRANDDPDYSFYRPFAITTDDAGNMFVADSGTYEILVYDTDGRFTRRFGREGQGPGEFTGEIIGGFTFAAGKLTIDDDQSPRLSIWDAQGNYLEAVPDFHRSLRRLYGLDDGTYVGTYSVFHESGATPRVREFVAHFGAGGEDTTQIHELPTVEYRPGGGLVPTPRASLTVARDGSVYLTPATEYEVFSLSLAGGMDWALRVTWDRAPVTDGIIAGIDPYLELQRRQGGQVFELEWPATMPALSLVNVDGHGHVYVVPYVYVNSALMLRNLVPGLESLPSLPDPPALIPVDVFSPTGELLYSGMMESAGEFLPYWSDARGDLVYDLKTDFETGERYVARSRLIEPF